VKIVAGFCSHTNLVSKTGLLVKSYDSNIVKMMSTLRIGAGIGRPKRRPEVAVLRTRVFCPRPGLEFSTNLLRGCRQSHHLGVATGTEGPTCRLFHNIERPRRDRKRTRQPYQPAPNCREADKRLRRCPGFDALAFAQCRADEPVHPPRPSSRHRATRRHLRHRAAGVVKKAGRDQQLPGPSPRL